ncbi:MAG: DUF2953 domain-containing protein [Ruminococcus sp.]|nr:DUF2953 domain-containing protein [Ruminococcus sp.]
MLALYITLGVLLLLFSITLLNVVWYAEYDEELRVLVRIGFIKIQLAPQKPEKKKKKKPKKKQPQKKKKKKTTKPKEKKPSFIKQLHKEHGVSGIINIVQRIAELVVGVLKGVFSHLIVTELTIKLDVAGEDAADSAIKYGRVCAALFPALGAITKIVKVKHYNVNVTPVFSDKPGTTRAYAKAKAKLRLIHILRHLLTKGLSALKLFTDVKNST